MKTTTINLNVYEVGDVIELDRKNLRLVSKQRSYAESHRAIVMGVNQRVDKLFTYKLIADNGKMFNLVPNEQGEEKYVGHVDLGLLFEGAGGDD